MKSPNPHGRLIPASAFPVANPVQAEHLRRTLSGALLAAQPVQNPLMKMLLPGGLSVKESGRAVQVFHE